MSGSTRWIAPTRPAVGHRPRDEQTPQVDPVEAAAVVGDPDLAVRADGGPVGSSTAVGDDLDGPVRADPAERAAGDLDDQHGAVLQRRGPLGEAQPLCDGAVLGGHLDRHASDRTDRPPLPVLRRTVPHARAAQPTGSRRCTLMTVGEVIERSSAA